MGVDSIFRLPQKVDHNCGRRMRGTAKFEPERTDSAQPPDSSRIAASSPAASVGAQRTTAKGMPIERQKEIRQLKLQCNGSVRNMAARFMGSSIPDTAESFQQKMRRSISASGPRASNTHLRKFTRIDKERFLRSWATSVTLQDAADDGVTRENAVAFLSSCGVTVQSVGIASWLQWVEAIDVVVAHNRRMSFDCVDFTSPNTSVYMDQLTSAMRNAVCDDSDFSAWLNANADVGSADDGDDLSKGYESSEDEDERKWTLESDLKPLANIDDSFTSTDAVGEKHQEDHLESSRLDDTACSGGHGLGKIYELSATAGAQEKPIHGMNPMLPERLRRSSSFSSRSDKSSPSEKKHTVRISLDVRLPGTQPHEQHHLLNLQSPPNVSYTGSQYQQQHQNDLTIATAEQLIPSEQGRSADSRRLEVLTAQVINLLYVLIAMVLVMSAALLIRPHFQQQVQQQGSLYSAPPSPPYRSVEHEAQLQTLRDALTVSNTSELLIPPPTAPASTAVMIEQQEVDSVVSAPYEPEHGISSEDEQLDEATTSSSPSSLTDSLTNLEVDDPISESAAGFKTSDESPLPSNQVSEVDTVANNARSKQDIQSIESAVQEATELVKLGDYYSSVQKLLDVIEIAPRHLPANVLLGAVLMTMDRNREAEVFLSTAANLSLWKDHVVVLNLAQCLLFRNDIAGALALVKRGFEASDVTESKSITAAAMGDILSAQKELEAAADWYLIAALNQPHNLQLWRKACTLDYPENKRDYKFAENVLLRAIQFNPESSMLYSSLGHVLLNTDRVVDAMTILSEALRIDATNTVAQNFLSTATVKAYAYAEQLLHRGRERDCLDVLIAILKVDVDHRDSNALMGAILVQRQEYEAADRFLHSALTSSNWDDLSSVLNLAQSYVGSGNNDVAVKALQLGYNSTSSIESKKILCVKLGELFISMHQYNLSADWLLRAALLAGSDVQLWISASTLRFPGANKNYQFAERVLMRGLELNPLSSELYQHLSSILVSTNRFQDAVVLLREAVRLDNKNVEAMAMLATALHSTGQLREAAEYYRRAEASNTHNSVFLANFAQLMNSLGHIQQGKILAQRALALNANDPEVVRAASVLLQ